ncbi:MAG: D-alanyl-D-alanine carboxypeptidase [Candidatus Tokpelaia sp.]|uniref:D-alanyl-D-alanine carboxypeptidase family protein n=1 Tax=Candidatus Tokpelaia sp. TaxID=2233777 RepID=UPI00123867B4|nr:D-alanyl-D-alanine carboxypeptidase family protein [Candidatus Tokpelaia sp.]KAA6205373.1 MAG: D-alanyl-D-alanine carboxypeptidase [Candidatus Tokpelaia sp.]KAA6206806.1 MAG: D-alanyl-D-alanine carboxypeptidase [Candidatus Tokpelaia sp.]KAA6406207.1 D-alanyl-D-alanine carboxypeptidase [Candidatus Tokpelaia sp.]
MYKKIPHLLMPLLLVLCLNPAMAAPYITVDMNGRVLAHNQAFDRWYPASLTKMMTAYVTFQALEAGLISLQTPIRLSAQAAHVAPSLSGWRAGSTLTLDTALTVMLVKSANDMANAVGEAVKGSAAAFVEAMNEQAQRLGMTGTHFANPSGLPDEQNYSNARDIAVLAVQLRRDFPQYAHYFDIPAIDFGKGRRIQPNSNNLIGRYDGADGMKTGFICASGFNLVASATRGGRTIITVVLGADRIDLREDMAAHLLSQGFKKSGSARISLATLRPYGDNQMQAANLRGQICNAEASRRRMQYRDEKGRPIFNSPFIEVLSDRPPAVAVRPIYEPRPEPLAKSKKAQGSKTRGAGAKNTIKPAGGEPSATANAR